MFNFWKKTLLKQCLWGMFLSLAAPCSSYAMSISLNYSADQTAIVGGMAYNLISSWRCYGPTPGASGSLAVSGYALIASRSDWDGNYYTRWYFVRLRSDSFTANFDGLQSCSQYNQALNQALSKISSLNLYLVSATPVNGSGYGTGEVSFNGLTTSYSSSLLHPSMPPEPPPKPHSCKASDLNMDFGSFNAINDNPVIQKTSKISCNYVENVTLSTPNDTIQFSNAGDSGFRAVISPVQGSFPLNIKVNSSASIPLQATLKANCQDLTCVPPKAYSGGTTLIVAFD